MEKQVKSHHEEIIRQIQIQVIWSFKNKSIMETKIKGSSSRLKEPTIIVNINHEP